MGRESRGKGVGVCVGVGRGKKCWKRSSTSSLSINGGELLAKRWWSTSLTGLQLSTRRIILATWGSCNLVRVCPQHHHNVHLLSHHSWKIALRWQVGNESLAENCRYLRRRGRGVTEVCLNTHPYVNSAELLVCVCVCVCVCVTSRYFEETSLPPHSPLISHSLRGLDLVHLCTQSETHSHTHTHTYIFQYWLLFSSPTLVSWSCITFPKLSMFILYILILNTTMSTE